MSSPGQEGPIRVVKVPLAPVHKVAYRLSVTAIFVALVLCLVALLILESLPSISLLAALLVLVITATHREAFFGDETAVNGSMVIVCASVVALHPDGGVLGPMLCGTAAGIRWTHLKNRVWSRLLVNCSATGFAGAASAMTFNILAGTDEISVYLVAAIPLSALTYWLVDNLLITGVLTFVTGEAFSRRALELVRAESELILFGIAGGAAGLAFARTGMWLGIMTLIALLAIVDLRILSSPAGVTIRTKRASRNLIQFSKRVIWLGPLIATFWIATHLTVVGSLPAGIALGLLLLFGFAFVMLRRRTGSWDLAFALGVVIPDAPLVVLLAAGGLIAAEVGAVIAAGLVAVVLTIGALFGRRLRRRREIDATDEAALLTAIEIALLDGHDVPTLSR